MDNEKKIYRCVNNIIKNSHKGNIDSASHALNLLLQNIPYRLSRPFLIQNIANNIHSISHTTPHRIPKSHQKKLQRALQRDQQFDSYRKQTILWLKSFIAIYRVIRVVVAVFAFLHQKTPAKGR